MRKKQVLALLLTGVMTLSAAPAAVFAEEDVSAVSIEAELEAGIETPAEAPAEAAEETPVETPAEEPTEAPVETPVTETPAEAPTETPTETPVTETPVTETPVTETPVTETPVTETPVTDTPVETPAAEIPAEDTEATPTVTPTEAATGPFSIGENSYATLAEALAAVTSTFDGEETDVIMINQDMEIDSTVSIPSDTSVAFAAPAGKAIKISRAAGFTGNMFEVNDTSLLYFGADLVDAEGNDLTGTLTIDGAGDGSASDGSIVSVNEGCFALCDGTVLTGNSTSAKGSAVLCTDGVVSLSGGSVTNNKTSADGGAIYSNSTVYVNGTLNISGNTGAEGAVSNIVLENDSSVTNAEEAVLIEVDDVLANSTIGVRLVNPAAGVPVIYVSTDVDGTTTEDVLPQFVYDGSEYTIDSTGALKSTDEPVQEALTAKITASSWLSTSKVKVTGTANKDGLAYIRVVKKGSTAPTADEIIAANKHVNATVKDGFTFSYTFSKDEKEAVGTNPVTVYVCVVSGEEKVVTSIDMDENSRPPRVSGVSAAWTGHSSAKIVCRSDKAGTAYWGWVEHGASAPGIEKCSLVSTVTANANFDVYADNLDSDNAIDVYIYVKSNDGSVSAPLVAQLNQNSRPSVNPTTTPTREPIVPSVNESKVTGLENPLEFYPNTFYDFTVVGAGTQNTDPVEGDVRWVPLYWSTSSNPSDSEKHSTWKIGAKNGIKSADTFNMYIFYRQEKYTGNGWQATDNIVSVTYQFRSADIDFDSVTPTPTAGTDGYTGYDEYGNPVTQTDDTTDTGSTTASGARTADESPIGTMSLLAVLSLLAGGYVITGKRKKSN